MATVESDLVLIVKRRLPVARDLVYKAWTTPESLRKWHAPGAVTCVDVDIDLRVGGRYRIAMQSPDSDTLSVATGEYREIVPNERLVYTWQWETDTNGVGETLVTLNFRPLPTGSELELIHERFVKIEHCDDHTKGWTAIMEKLAHLY